MSKMPYARRIRTILFSAIIATLVIIYLTTGAEQTRNSQFYTRTIELMEAKARGQRPPPPHAQHRAGGVSDSEEKITHEEEDDVDTQKGRALNKPEDSLEAAREGAESAQRAYGDTDRGQQYPLDDSEDDLRDRLKDAETAAKKSADSKYKKLQDIQDEVEKEREARELETSQTQKATSKGKEGDSTKKTSSNDKKYPQTHSDNSKDTEKKSSKPSKDDEEEEEDLETTKMRQLLAEILAKAPVTIFSKTYCPHSAKAKHILLEAYSVQPKPNVVELDEHRHGEALQKRLMKTTGRRTVPNVLVNGKSIGGGDETEMLWKSGEMPARIKQLGGKRVESVKQKIAYGKESSAHGLRK
ncbi:MAG: hypothetical protein M1831_006893 [Alyxoria varia]|nr:MAG: hypothetical protein M1831_006893 [Alyxoria varia]